MKRILFVCLLVLILPLAATAGTPSASAPFFASRHQPKVIQNKDGCSANVTCPNGTPISCTSGVPGTCTAGSTYVVCNGVRTDCPTTTCFAENECCDGSSVYCEGNTCSVTARGVRCDGIGYLCPRCPILP
jgi:hypothetical protein